MRPRTDVTKTAALAIATVMLVAGCASVPAGPSVMVIPGNGKDFDQFRVDDAACRQWASQHTGRTPGQAATENAVGGAVIGTVLGAALGALLGAAAHSPATGAAIGAGGGAIMGTAIGAGNGEAAGTTVQQRYDMSYTQCMYAKGNQIPVARGSQPAYAAPTYTPPPPPPPPTSSSPSLAPPPPPPGPPPPPPPR